MSTKFTFVVPEAVDEDALEWFVRVLQINGVRAGTSPAMHGGRYLTTLTTLPQADREHPIPEQWARPS